jgi:hypothetical protein
MQQGTRRERRTERDVKSRKVVLGVSLGNDVEGGAGVEDVVVKGEVTAADARPRQRRKREIARQKDERVSFAQDR